MEKNLNKLFAKTAIATIVAASVLTLSACDHKYQLGQNSRLRLQTY
jgi:FKBP-type peptidyl-prolyl cis-trans isomerase FkpA